MTERTTNILGWLTLVAVLAAIWVLFGEDPTREHGARGEPTFPGLEGTINEAVKAKVWTKDGKGHVTLSKGDAGWTIEERGGYPADDAKVLTFLRGLVTSTRREPKTGSESGLKEVGLGPDAPAIEVMGANDKMLAIFKQGKRRAHPDGKSLTYVIRPDEERSWLVTDLAEVSADPAFWIEPQVFDIKESRVAEVTLSGVTLSRGLDATDFSVLTAREDEKPAGAWELREPAHILTALTATDVRSFEGLEAAPVQTVSLKTYDGLTIMLELYALDDATWARPVAFFDPSARDQGEPGILPDAPEDGAAEAEAIKARVNGWLYRLAEADAKVLLKDRSGFVTETKVTSSLGQS